MSAPRVVRVLPDVPAIDRAFDYLVPVGVPATPTGTMVRVPLSGRRVAGWVLEDDVEPAADRSLSELSKVTGVGPPPEVVELCRWASWRWAGRLATMLRLASPSRSVRSVPPVRVRPARSEQPTPWPPWSPGAQLLESSPLDDPLELAAGLAGLGQVIVVSPSVVVADRLARGLRSRGAAVARWPGDWAAAAGGATVVGGRGAVFAPAPELAGIVVLDEHDEALQSESSPTWHAREVAIERARRAGVPCVLVSPCPSLEARLLGSDLGSLDGAVTPQLPVPTVRVPRSVQRSGWAPLDVVDRRGEDVGRTGLYSSRVVEAVRETARSERRVLCVLNRTGRARLLACRSCGSMAECAVCAAAVRQDDDGRLVCDRCGASRPGVCAACGSGALALLRVGVTRAREELEALVREPVEAISGTSDRGESESGEREGPGARVVVGTEAALHRVADAGLVVFLDLDQELLAPRYRAAEEALSLLVRASRLVGGRSRGGRVMVQTRLPEHEVIQAALRADPALLSRSELERRALLGLPPTSTIAVVGGEAAPAYVEAVGHPVGVEVLQRDEATWLLRSREPSVLLDHLATLRRPPGRLRLQVDPLRFR